MSLVDRILRRPLPPRLARIADMLRSPSARGAYRSVWNQVALTEDGAKVGVAGTTDEEGLRRAAQETCRVLAQTVGLSETDDVLEIGCGVGRVGAVLAPQVRSWTGLDVSDNMLHHARRRLAGHDNVHLARGAGGDLGAVPAEAFDLIYCTVVFMHLDEFERWSYIRDALRALRPGGRLMVDNVNLLDDDGWRFFLKTAADHPPDRRPPHVSRPSTPQELRAYLERAGFEDIQQLEHGLWIVTWGRRPEA